MKKTLEELKAEAIEMLADNDDLFINIVNELDSWNGFADGFRAYYMDDLDELFYGCKISDFLSNLTNDFSYNDEYFCETIYGLTSCNDCAEWYKEHTDAEEVFENALEYWNKIYCNDSEFSGIMNAIFTFEEEEEEEEEETV